MSEAMERERQAPADPAALLARADYLKGRRAVFDSHWQEVADFILPSREFTRTNQPGAKRLTRIFNGTPCDAAKQLAGGLHGMLTSPALRWFQLRPQGMRGQNGQFDDPVTAWFEAATDRMYEEFNSPKAGFNASVHEVYLDLSGFGTSALFIGDAGPRGPTFQAIPLKEMFIACNAGRVDTAFRLFQLPARAIEAMWPKVQAKVVQEACDKEPDRLFDLVHAVLPRDEDERGGMPFRSVYLLREGMEVLEAGGFREFPYCIPRWSKRSGEDYGDGPGMDALPDVKLLNKLEELNLRGLAKVVDPPLMAPHDGFLGPITTQPGGINYFQPGLSSDERISPMETGARPDLGLEYIQAIEARVQRTFYTTWMNLPTRPNMTATEVLQRRDEQLRLLGPMVSRLQEELLGPLIERVFSIMWRAQLFPPPPEELAGTQWEVEYLSPLALSQKASDADAVVRWASALGQLAQFDPSALDVLDSHAAGRFLGDRYGVSQTVMRSEREAQGMAQQRQQQQAQAAQIEGAQGMARAAKDGMGALAALGQGQGQGAPA